jgi:hypothetical protein
MEHYDFIQNLPRDILSLLLDFLPLYELAIVSQVSKLFRNKIEMDGKWKKGCLSWWKDKIESYPEKVIRLYSLEELVNITKEIDSSKDWRWFAQCFAREDKKKGITFEINSWGTVCIGNIKNIHPMIGWGLYLGYIWVDIGKLAKGNLTSFGTRLYWQSGTKMTGHWKKGLQDGQIITSWRSYDVSHQTEWNSGKPKGK